MLKVTVITVCYNEKERLRKTIESVSCQTYSNIEYIVIDGDSTDGTQKIFSEYSRYSNIFFYSEKDYGIYNAMNRGIARASGDYIYFINAGDTMYNKHVISDVVSFIGNDKDTIYYGKIYISFADGVMQMQDFSNTEKTLRERLIIGEMPCHQSIFSPRRALTNHYFREQYKIRADYEWLLYSLIQGNKYRAVPTIIGYYDASGTSGRLKNMMMFQKEEQDILNEYQRSFTEDEIKLFQETVNDRGKMASKYMSLFQLMNYWMIQKNNNVNVGEYLLNKGYKYVAIYGISHIGVSLIQELNGYNIKVEYAIDKNKDNLCMNINTFSPDDDLDEVDAIIVTALDHFIEIERMLKLKVKCPILSLEDVIYEM